MVGSAIERFLEICGEHFEDYITKDIENILDVMIDKQSVANLRQLLWKCAGL